MPPSRPKSSQDAIDVAILKATDGRGDLRALKQTAFVPFDPVNKRTISTVVDQGGQVRHYAKRCASGGCKSGQSG